MIDDNGIEFGCPIGKGYNYDDRRFILNNIHDYMGKRATFTYFDVLKQVATDIHYTKQLEIMSKLIWKLYNENLISKEVANILLDKHYE